MAGPVLTGDGHLVLESVATNGHNGDTNRFFSWLQGIKMYQDVSRCIKMYQVYQYIKLAMRYVGTVWNVNKNDLRMD